jgi:hypothetical protein
MHRVMVSSGYHGQFLIFFQLAPKNVDWRFVSVFLINIATKSEVLEYLLDMFETAIELEIEELFDVLYNTWITIKARFINVPVNELDSEFLSKIDTLLQ